MVVLLLSSGDLRELGISSTKLPEEAGRWQHLNLPSDGAAPGGLTEVRVEVNKSSLLVWLNLVVAYYLGTRANWKFIRRFLPLFRYTLAIMLLAIGGAWFIAFRRPLVDLT